MAAMGNKDLVLFDVDGLESDETPARRGFWRKVRRTLGRIPFTEELIAAYFCATDRRTPAYVKAVLMAAIAYFIVPTDLIPDFIATLGYSDDATVLYAAIATVRRHLKPEHREKARAVLDQKSGEPAPSEGPRAVPL